MSSPSSAGKRVKQRRERRGWSQAELARRAGVSRAAVSAIEIDRLVPSVAAAMKIAAALEATVEQLFGHIAVQTSPEWAWPPRPDDRRFWQAEVAGRTVRYPAEETAAGVAPHDGAGHDAFSPNAAASRTLVMASCDPAAGLLAAEYARQTGMRLIVLRRSSSDALELLKQGLIHVAAIHFSAAGRKANRQAVGDRLDQAAGLLRLARWDAGVVLDQKSSVRRMSPATIRKLAWVGREPGSGAYQCYSELFGRPAEFKRIAFDHRGVAEAVRCGWAEAGVCLRLTGVEAGLRFLPVRHEDADLCFWKSSESDPRIRGLIAVARSPEFRRLLGDLPGYDARHTGELDWTAP